MLTNWLGEERVVRIVEQGAQFHGAGCRVDGAVDGGELAACDLPGLAAVIGIGLKHRATTHAGHDLVDAVFRNGEQHRHGLDLRDDHDAIGLARLHQIADIDLTDACPSIDRRGDLAIGKVQRGGRDISLIGGDDAFILFDEGLLGGKLLLRNRLGVPQRLVAREIGLGVGQRRGIAGELALAWSRAAWNGRGSISASTSPFFTIWPSVKWKLITGPLTCGRTVTVASGVTVPSALSVIGIGPWATLATPTGWAAPKLPRCWTGW